jgi:NAD(P)-dependent dehydrogenase (short-subunit alcohol dehydrogenase family)
MSGSGGAGARRVVVVTGGAAGIGAAIAEELGRRGDFVVTMDPVVAVDGRPLESTEQTTAQRIVEAGGAARASSTSVTDLDAVQALLSDLVAEFGRLDAVVNVAGISRPTGFASGTEEDWARVLDVHLNGYLNVLRAALPIMVGAGHGRIVGVTSGSGWRAADAGAYGCAKRAVAALTWQIGQVTPDGVTVNALSPIAATRMVANALSRQGPGGDPSGRSAASGGVALGAAPPPEHLGPVGAYLASDEFAWCRGQIIFSNGAEVSPIEPPRLLEVARTADTTSLAHALDALVTGAFAPAEGAQSSSGGSVPRLGRIFDEPGDRPGTAPVTRRCVVITDDGRWGGVLTDALSARAVECVGVGPWTPAVRGPSEIASGFAAAADQLAQVARDTGPLDAVVVALAGAAPSTTGVGTQRWQQILDEHAGITDQIRADAAWVRAVADYSASADRPVRVVTLTDATSAGGSSRAMAAAQLARAAHGATANRVDAFAVGVEERTDSARRATAELVGRLVSGDDVAALSGAELVTASEWLALRSHPKVAGTVTYGGPEIPGWLDAALRRMIAGEFES